MIMHWLREGNASWKELCLALAQEYVGHINLAKQIANQHRISQPTDQSTAYPHQLESNLSHPTADNGEQLPSNQQTQESLIDNRIKVLIRPFFLTVVFCLYFVFKKN